MVIPGLCAAGGCEALFGGMAASIWMSSPAGKKAISNTLSRSQSKEEDCECKETRSRSEAEAQAHAWAGIPAGGGPEFQPLPWNPNFNFPKGMSPKDRAWGDFKRQYYPPNYGWSSPAGASVVEHPLGHPDQPGPEHHKCPHFHAVNSAGVEAIFTYKPGSP
jgi:hypothetical protein